MLYFVLLRDSLNPLTSSTYHLLDWKTVGVAVVIRVCEDPAITRPLGLKKGLDFCVVLAVQRCLTRCLILKQLHFILEQK